jgi:hypothetical protein
MQRCERCCDQHPSYLQTHYLHIMGSMRWHFKALKSDTSTAVTTAVTRLNMRLGLLVSLRYPFLQPQGEINQLLCPPPVSFCVALSSTLDIDPERLCFINDDQPSCSTTTSPPPRFIHRNLKLMNCQGSEGSKHFPKPLDLSPTWTLPPSPPTPAYSS